MREAVPGDREHLRSLVLVVLRDFHAKIFAQHLIAIIPTLAERLAEACCLQCRHTYRINFPNALSKIKNNLVRLSVQTSPPELCWRLPQRMVDKVEAARSGRTL